VQLGLDRQNQMGDRRSMEERESEVATTQGSDHAHSHGTAERERDKSKSILFWLRPAQQAPWMRMIRPLIDDTI
jgi:hypothetical protein